MDQYRSIAAFDAVEMGELSVIDGEVVTVIEKNTSGKIIYSQKSTGLLPCMMSLSRYICMYVCKTLFQHAIFVIYLHQLVSTKGVLCTLNLKYITRHTLIKLLITNINLS